MHWKSFLIAAKFAKNMQKSINAPAHTMQQTNMPLTLEVTETAWFWGRVEFTETHGVAHWHFLPVGVTPCGFRGLE